MAKAQSAGPEYHALLANLASQHGVDPKEADAVWWLENRHQLKGISPKGAVGPMQIMPDPIGPPKDYGYTNEDLYDPVKNMQIGVKHYSRLRQQYGSPTLAFAAYNAGEGTVNDLIKKYGSSEEQLLPHLPKETQNYVANARKRLTGTQSSMPPANSLLNLVSQTNAGEPVQQNPLAMLQSLVSQSGSGQPQEMAPQQPQTSAFTPEMLQQMVANAQSAVPSAVPMPIPQQGGFSGSNLIQELAAPLLVGFLSSIVHPHAGGWASGLGQGIQAGVGTWMELGKRRAEALQSSQEATIKANQKAQEAHDKMVAELTGVQAKYAADVNLRGVAQVNPEDEQRLNRARTGREKAQAGAVDKTLKLREDELKVKRDAATAQIDLAKKRGDVLDQEATVMKKLIASGALDQLLGATGGQAASLNMPVGGTGATMTMPLGSLPTK